MRRIVTAVGLVLVGAMGMQVFAGDTEGVPDRSRWGVEDRLRALELEVSVLQARETAVSAFILANAERADGLEKLAKQCRNEGFTSGAISSRSRETLLKGIAALAVSLRMGLPVATDDESAAREQAADFLKTAAKRAAPKPKAPPQPKAPPAPKPDEVKDEPAADDGDGE